MGKTYKDKDKFLRKEKFVEDIIGENRPHKKKNKKPSKQDIEQELRDIPFMI
jgi:hypothetical protein